VQIRGLVFLKDSDAILRDVSKIFLSTLNDELQQSPYDLNKLRDDVYDKCLRSIRRQTGKEPMVLPLIIEIA
jgi:ribonuclease J